MVDVQHGIHLGSKPGLLAVLANFTGLGTRTAGRTCGGRCLDRPNRRIAGRLAFGVDGYRDRGISGMELDPSFSGGGVRKPSAADEWDFPSAPWVRASHGPAPKID